MYCDANFGGDYNDSKSTSGAVMALVGPNSVATISAMCKKQSVVSHSSTEAEIVSLDVALRNEGLPILNFWECIFELFSKA